MSKTVNVQVNKNQGENSTALIRRFTKRVQGSGILPRLKSIRFHDRPKSQLKKKREALKRIRKQEERQKLIKLGKISENPFGYRR